jgi:hypothetical protein
MMAEDKMDKELKKYFEAKDKRLDVTKETSPELKKSFAEKLNKAGGSRGGGGGGGGMKPDTDITSSKRLPKMAKGGSVSARADGACKKGHTKGRMV